MKNSKFILITIVCLVIVVAGYRYKEYVLDRDFVVLATVGCEEGVDSCFFWDCTAEEEGCDTSPYGKVEIAAYEAPGCLLENECEEFSCEEYESCRVVNCSIETRASWEGCVMPE